MVGGSRYGRWPGLAGSVRYQRGQSQLDEQRCGEGFRAE
jgi:hypothetical protein